MRSIHYFTTALFAAAVTAAGMASGQPAKLDNTDVAFMTDAAHAGNTEMEASKLAAERASNAQIKSFAVQMAEDHAKAAAELKRLAAAKGTELPEGPSMMQKTKLKLLGAMKGERFDRQYADEIGVEAHEDTVKLFRKASAEARDPDVKAFATKTLPTLERHLGMARDLKATVATSSSK